MHKIVFVSGTRADYGKIKPLISTVASESDFEVGIFVTGMHLLDRYGQTWRHISQDFGQLLIWPFPNQVEGDPQENIFCKTILGLSQVVGSFKPDLIVIHGDRVEALAGAIVGLFSNILVAHIEGGEISGTQDEMIRHSVTKLSDLHFVANANSVRRIVQMGENMNQIFEIGSPEVDLMLGESLPNLRETCFRYEIGFTHFAILIFHPVSTELESLHAQAEQIIKFAINSHDNFVVIESNNDPGSEIIRSVFDKVRRNNRFRFLPSMRFEHFATLLKNALYIVGNSSSGVREAQLFGTPCINVGSRQNGRALSNNIVSAIADSQDIMKSRDKVLLMPRVVTNSFGTGKSSDKFKKILKNPNTLRIPKQKTFVDLEGTF